MAAKSAQRKLWELSGRQYGVVSRRQLLDLGFSPAAIRQRLETGRLHTLTPGVYAVGRPEVEQRGHWMAAVLAGGRHAALSHRSAAEAWNLRPLSRGRIEISVPLDASARSPGIRVHRRCRSALSRFTEMERIRVTDPVLTLVDLAGRLTTSELERAVGEADKLDLIDPERLRRALDSLKRIPGVGVLRRALDRSGFVLTESELERRLIPIVEASGLPPPETGVRLNGFKTDFYWPQLGLVVETDGLRYHRTAGQQAHDRRRDQAHARAGLTTLRFTYAQVRFEPMAVKATLRDVGRRLAGSR